MESHTHKCDVDTKDDALPRPEDYSFHLIAARKALATAEAQAALHNWVGAIEGFMRAGNEAIDAANAIAKFANTERA